MRPIAPELPNLATCASAATHDTYEIIRDRAALDALRPEWDALWRRAAHDYLMQTHDWAGVTLDNPPDARPRHVFCLTARRAGALGLIWPFVIYRHAVWRMATPVAAEWGDYSSVLVEDCADRDERVAAAWRALRHLCPCDLIDLRFVRESSPLQRALARDNGRTVALYGLDAPWARLAGTPDFASYWRTRNPAHRRDFARKRRRLAEHGSVHVEEITDPARGVELIDWMIHHKRLWLDHIGREDRIRLRTRQYPRFLKAQVLAFLPTGRCIIFALMCGEQPLALDLASIDKTRLEWNVGTFDAAWRHYSPGNILKEYEIRWAIARGLDYDMRLGGGQHKRLWGNRIEVTVTYRTAVSLWGGVWLGLKQAVAAMRRGRPA